MFKKFVSRTHSFLAKLKLNFNQNSNFYQKPSSYFLQLHRQPHQNNRFQIANTFKNLVYFTFSQNKAILDPHAKQPANGIYDIETFQLMMQYIIEDKLYSKEANCKPDERFSQMIQFLRQPISIKCLTSSQFQTFRFSKVERYFPTGGIQKRLYRALMDEKKIFLFRGPKETGKSHNLAIFSALLRSCNRYNVIYIHELEQFLLCNQKSTLLESLMLTLPSDFQENLSRLEQQIDDDKKFWRELRQILQFSTQKNKKTVLLVDQFNSMDRLDKELGLSSQYLQKKEIFWELTSLADKCIFLSSMTDAKANPTKSMIQNIQYEDLNETMGDRELEEFILYMGEKALKNYFSEHKGEQIEEEKKYQIEKDSLPTLSEKQQQFIDKELRNILIKKQRIIDKVGKNPGQIRRLFEINQQNIEETKIEHKLNTFYIKAVKEIFDNLYAKLSDNPKREALRDYYVQLGQAMDTGKGFPMNAELFPLVDTRYLTIDMNKISSQSPYVKAAFLLFQSSSFAKDQLDRAYSGGDNLVFEKQFEKFLINYFEFSTQIQSILQLFKGCKLQDDRVRMEFTPHGPRVSIELQRDIEILKSTYSEFYTLCVPRKQNFPGISFVLVMKKKKEVYIFHAKSDLDGLAQWKDIFEGQDNIQVRQFTDMCKKEKYQVYFVFSFLLCDKRDKFGDVDDNEISKRLDKLNISGEILIFDASQMIQLQSYKKCSKKQSSNKKETKK